MKAVIGIILSSQGTLEPPEAGRGTKGYMILSNSLQREPGPANTLILNFRPLEL